MDTDNVKVNTSNIQLSAHYGRLPQPLQISGGKFSSYEENRIGVRQLSGKLRYDEAVLHGRPMTATAAGEHDLQNGRFDLTLLVLERPDIPLHNKGAENAIREYVKRRKIQ